MVLQFYQRLTMYKFTLLLIFQLLFILIYPIFEGGLGEWILHTLASLFYLWVVTLCATQKQHKIFNGLLFMLLFATYVLDYLNYFEDIHPLLSLGQFKIFYCCVFVLFYVYTTFVMAFHMLTDRKPHVDTLSGTASVYLMIALTWTFFYLSLESFMPNSFRQGLSQDGLTYINWLFYSISTLVSSSVSTVMPITSAAQSISILESIIGALYIAIITARIVGVDFDDPNRIRPENPNYQP